MLIFSNVFIVTFDQFNESLLKKQNLYWPQICEKLCVHFWEWHFQ